jgi:hypothetical protein
VGLYNAQILITEFTMVFLLDNLFPAWSAERERSGTWLWTRSDGVAPFHVLSNGAVVMLMVWLPADLLVECSSLLGGLTILVVLVRSPPLPCHASIIVPTATGGDAAAHQIQQ